MLYLAYQTHADFMDSVRQMATAGLAALGPWAGNGDLKLLRNVTAAYELIARSRLTHVRPPYGIGSVRVGNREVAVAEEVVMATPFGTLLRFRKDIDTPQPRVLLVAPLSGHFATLLRNTVKTLLPDHDVSITDWHNARDVSAAHGRFGFDDYVDHLIRFLEALGPGTHVVAVCQPCVQVLAAAAVMAERGSPAQPRSMTLMAGPIDTTRQPHQGQRARPLQADRLVRAQPDRARALALRRGAAAGLSGLRAARGLHVHEHRSAHKSAPRALRASGRRRGGEGRDHQGVLRRVFCRPRPHRRVLPGDGGVGVPGRRGWRRASSRSAASVWTSPPSAGRHC
jgi:hypothetical protein